MSHTTPRVPRVLEALWMWGWNCCWLAFPPCQITTAKIGSGGFSVTHARRGCDEDDGSSIFADLLSLLRLLHDGVSAGHGRKGPLTSHAASHELPPLQFYGVKGFCFLDRTGYFHVASATAVQSTVAHPPKPTRKMSVARCAGASGAGARRRWMRPGSTKASGTAHSPPAVFFL